MAIVTQEEVEHCLGLAGGEDSIRINELINYWSDRIIMACKPAILGETIFTDEKYDGDGSATLYLNHFPILSIDKLETKLQGEIPASDYWLYAKKGVIVLKFTNFRDSPQEITISYKAGYKSGGYPDDIKLLCLECIADGYKEVQAEVRATADTPYPPKAEIRLNESPIIRRYKGYQV